MQDFYGNQPFIIDGKRVKTKKKERVNVGINRRFLFFVIIFALIAVSVAAYFTFGNAFTCVIPGRKYYAVCFYSGQIKSQAEEVSRQLYQGGGSGYVVSDGTYRVFGGVYADRDSAQSVAHKQEGDVFVEVFEWKQLKISRFSQQNAAQISEAMNYFDRVIADLTKIAVELDSGKTSEGATEYFLSTISDKFAYYANTVNETEVKNFFEKCKFSVDNNALGNAQNFSSAVKYVLHDLVMLRINVDLE